MSPDEPTVMSSEAEALVRYCARHMNLQARCSEPVAGLCAGARFYQDQNVILAATPCAPPTFRARLIRAAHRVSASALLLRHLVIHGTEVVMAECAVPTENAVLISVALAPCWLGDRLWLAPQSLVAPFFELSPDGIYAHERSPFNSADSFLAATRQAHVAIARERVLHGTVQ